MKLRRIRHLIHEFREQNLKKYDSAQLLCIDSWMIYLSRESECHSSDSITQKITPTRVFTSAVIEHMVVSICLRISYHVHKDHHQWDCD